MQLQQQGDFLGEIDHPVLGDAPDDWRNSFGSARRSFPNLRT